MSNAASPAANPLIAKLLPHVGWLVLLLSLSLLWTATERRIDRANAVSDLPNWSVDSPEREASSNTGYAGNQRSLIIPGHHNPSFWWIRDTQLAVENNSVRLRRINYEHTPDGRSISRTSPYRWWLTTTGVLFATIHSEPLGFSIEQATLFADPLLLGLAILCFFLFIAKTLGSLPASAFAIGAISLFPLAANFQPGAPDPHSLAWVLALASFLPLISALFDNNNRFFLIVAGVSGGLGLWNLASAHFPFLLGISVGAVAFELVREKENAAQIPWRLWAISGAATSLAASVFEFAPGSFSLSLDTVHPLHALFWIGAGELITAAARYRQIGKASLTSGFYLQVTIGLIAVLSYATTAYISDSGSLLASDFYAREIANHPLGGLGANLGAWLNKASAGIRFATLVPAAIIVVILIKIFIGKCDREKRARLILVFVPLLLTFVLAYQQLRWWNLFDAIALVAVVLLIANSAKTALLDKLKSLVFALPFLPGFFVGFPESFHPAKLETTPLERQALVERDFAQWLVQRAGEEPIVLYSTPIFSSAASYYGGFASVASSDDQNKDGYLTAVRIASANTEQEVSILLDTNTVSHIVLPMWDPMVEQLVRSGSNTPPGEELPPAAFVIALRDWDLPAWLRPLNYAIPQEGRYKGFTINAFSRGSEQQPDLALSRLADLFVERGMLHEAKSIRKVLEDYPRSVHALGATANIDFALRDQKGFSETMETLTPMLSRRAARNLPADRRINLAVLFMSSRKTDLAKDQIRACLDDLDENSLRQLSPSATTALLAISRSLKLSFPSPELESLALRLISPEVRSLLPQPL